MASTRNGLSKPVAILVIAIVVLRVAGVTWSALGRADGDFYASMPGAHVEQLNPTLWNSPDLAASWGYQQRTYFHGPSQYLALYPLSFLDSFATIATVLLPVYAALLAAMFWLLWKIAQHLGGTRAVFVPLLAATFLFFPLLQAYLQREFEVVLTVLLVAALWCLVTDRKAIAAALLAYAAWFKYIPLLFVGYLGLRRWWRATAVFAATSAAVLLVSQWLFGLSRFFNNNVPGHARQVLALSGFGFERDRTGHLHGTGFCSGWIDIETTNANVRHGLCTMSLTHAWINPPLIYVGLCVAIAVVYLWIDYRLGPAPLSATAEARRRAIEFSIVTTVCACFFFAHYYYLMVLVIPFGVLLTIYVADARPRALALWAIAYALVGAFVIPVGLLSRISGVNVWERFMWQSWFWYGEILLMGLLLFEYHRIAPVPVMSTRSAA
jgi:hypothetical protein